MPSWHYTSFDYINWKDLNYKSINLIFRWFKLTWRYKSIYNYSWKLKLSIILETKYSILWVQKEIIWTFCDAMGFVWNYTNLEMMIFTYKFEYWNFLFNKWKHSIFIQHTWALRLILENINKVQELKWCLVYSYWWRLKMLWET